MDRMNTFPKRLVLLSNTGITLSERFQRLAEERRLQNMERSKANRQRLINQKRGLQTNDSILTVKDGRSTFITINRNRLDSTGSRHSGQNLTRSLSNGQASNRGIRGGRGRGGIPSYQPPRRQHSDESYSSFSYDLSDDTARRQPSSGQRRGRGGSASSARGRGRPQFVRGASRGRGAHTGGRPSVFSRLQF